MVSDSSTYPINKITAANIKLDGKITEGEWKNTRSVSGFHLNFPIDRAYASRDTRVQLFFDENYIYLAATCAKKADDKREIRTLRRDFSLANNDVFSLILDPLNDDNNGFEFAVSAAGVLSESVLYNGGWRDAVWDNKWSAAVHQDSLYWSLEMRIPFSSIRYKEEQEIWGMNFTRTHIASNERSSWQAVPRQFDISTLSFAGELKWTSPPPKSSYRFSVIPYISGGMGRNRQSEFSTVQNIGTDFKVPISSSLNLDLTINPDFSQVEVDQQQINLDRFSLFFPERRNFFIENNDLFANFGFRQIRPFFSRRIGLDHNGGLIPIIMGARLSGKVNEDLRIGLLNIQEGEREDDGSMSNFSVACFQRQIPNSNSNLAGILVNKQVFNPNGETRFNRLAGVDYNILSLDNRVRGKLFFHKSFSDDNRKREYAHASWLRYQTRFYTAEWNHEFVSKTYNAELGFVPRQGRGYWRLEPWIERRFYPKNGIINSHGPKAYLDLYTDEAHTKTEHRIIGSYQFTFNNTSAFNVSATNYFLRLRQPFNPNYRDSSLFQPGIYEWNEFSMNFTSGGRKAVNLSFYGSYGSFYLGSKLSYGGTLNLRLQPYVRFSLRFDANELRMPEPYLDDNLMLISPRVDLSLSRMVFLSSNLQLNRQTDIQALNTRLQFRFKPMSDLFLVYNHILNQSQQNMIQQVVVLKLNYWLNV